MAKLKNWFLWTQYDEDAHKCGYMSEDRWQKHISEDLLFTVELNRAFDEIIKRKKDVDVKVDFQINGWTTVDGHGNQCNRKEYVHNGHYEEIPGDRIITSWVRKIIFEDDKIFAQTYSGSKYQLDGEKFIIKYDHQNIEPDDINKIIDKFFA